jgi:GrpB-like predicted nucleotidyltransferase (UPF0157 family)/GNAT superfamily N-acetyltransferase
MKIVKANPEDAHELSMIALKSKAHWPYPKDYLDQCVEALRITPEYISTWPVFKAIIEKTTVGFFTLKIINNENRLDNLWILPDFIGKKIGTQLFNHAISEAKKLNWTYFRLAADPYATSFYEKLGVVQIGTVQSRIKSDLFLPHMEFKIKNFALHPIPYDSNWPNLFQNVSDQIKKIWGNDFIILHHIGSTAIPGLMAKPIIDILGVIKNLNEITQLRNNQLIDLGFDSKGAFGIEDRSYYSRKTYIATHLHIFPENHFQIKKHFLFRDYLKAHPNAVSLYQNKKIELLNQFPDDANSYQSGKNELITELTRLAYLWNYDEKNSEANYLRVKF